MAKQKEVSNPKIGMNRATSPHLLKEGEYAFQLNGNSYDEGGEKFNLTDEHSNILASKFKDGFKFIGGKNHVVRDKTYIFLTNPTTNVSEIGCIVNSTIYTTLDDTEVESNCTDCPDYINQESSPLEDLVQVAHQEYVTLLEDSCNNCLGFDINHPIFDILIKEQNIGTKMFWTSTPGNKEFRYIELDDLEKYKKTGEDNCGAVPTDTCLDCDKLRVFRLYTELKSDSYQRVLGGNLTKGSYEILGAYTDQLGNEFTSYTPLTPIIPIFDEGNIIHEQVDNNAETNFAIKVELSEVDTVFDFYKIAVRRYSSKGVFTSFVEGVHNTSDRAIILANSDGGSISNTKISLKKPFVETVDGATASNNILLLNGVREREPINLQPVINLAGLGVKWMSFRAKEDLYSNADSYKYIGYNRDENTALAIDFGMKDGYRTNNYVFIPRPATEDEMSVFDSGDDYSSITQILDDCDGNIRNKKWQFYNTATETGACPSTSTSTSGVLVVGQNYVIDTLIPGDDFTNVGYVSEDVVFQATAATPTVWTNLTIVALEIETIEQTENVTTYTTVEPITSTSGLLVDTNEYLINTLIPGDDFTNLGYVSEGVVFTATGTAPTDWMNGTEVINITDSIPFAPADSITFELGETESYTDLAQYIIDNLDTCGNANSPIINICPYVDLSTLTGYNNVPTTPAECSAFALEEEYITIDAVENELTTFDEKPVEDYGILPPPSNCYVFETNLTTGATLSDEEFGLGFNVTDISTPASCTKLRKAEVYNTVCTSAIDLTKVTLSNIVFSNFGSFYHLNKGTDATLLTSGALVIGETYVINTLETGVPDDNFVNVGYVSAGVEFIATGDTPTTWINSTVVVDVNASLTGLLSSKTTTITDGTRFNSNIHEGALWFKTGILGRNKFFLELTEQTACTSSCVASGSEVRVSIFDKCSSTVALFSKIIDLNDHQFIEIDVAGNLIDGTVVDFTLLLNDNLYVSVEVPIIQSLGYGEDYVDADLLNPPVEKYRLAPLCGCFNIVDREEEFSSITVTYDGITIGKTQKYTSTCVYEIPVLRDCEPVAYKYGELGYFESTEKYPDNDALYNSSTLVLNKSSITNVDFLDKLSVYKDNEDANQIYLSDEANFVCKPIRHYKLPDNKVSPFMGTNTVASNSDAVISPLGFTIDGEVIKNMLQVALDNNLMTQEQHDNVVDYKIYRADSTLDRSVVASGLVFNTKKYISDGEEVNYFNYPFNSLGKDKYFPANTDNPFDNIQVISPEFDYFRPSLPNEMSLQGFIYGKANSRVLPVEDHSKMVILGRKAQKLAETLAILEVTAEIIIATSNVVSNAQVGGGIGYVSTGFPAFIAASVVLAIGVVEGLVSKVARYRQQWETSFENLGTPYNFGYYTAAGSKYNYLKTLQTDGDRLRGLSTRKYLKSGMLNVTDSVSGTILKVNNLDREEAPFFSLGDFPINNLNPDYTTYDNSDVNPNFSSQILSSEIGCHVGKSPEKLRNIASPYAAFKNYIPNQYGTIGSIKWIDTTYNLPIETTGICNGILGGDTFISRHSKKRKARIFDTDLLGSADLIPFPYSFYSNYGVAKYFIDYKVDGTFSAGSRLFPRTFYRINFDCDTKEVTFDSSTLTVSSAGGFYVKPPNKFYLYSIAYTNFLCETRINTNFRNARKEPWNQFYPQNTDIEAITQPTIVSLTRDENYYYNKAYLQSNILNSSFLLPEYYSKENEALKAYNTNGGIYSLPDANENSITEPWLLYRPNDKFTLESRYGKLINMKGIESDQILMYFEDALQLQNSVNKFTDGSTQYNSDLGNGGIFAKRALTLRTTDIGYGGAQSKNTLSCEFGHFHADLKRGQIFKYTGGSNMEEVSRYSGNKPNGMDVWFKEHLPLKFAKVFPDHINNDNPYNGVGIHWGYDSKYRRVILTKKDYVLAKGAEVAYDVDTNTFNGLTFQEQVDNGNFKDVSWTLTYKPETGSWESYMSYTPNYYINHTNYFQSGINSNDGKHGLWSHLLTNKSYRVFYGLKFPYVIEYPVKNQYISKRLESISWNAQLRRHHNDFDFAPIEDNPFTAVTIYNNYENSGKLVPVINNGTLSTLSKYPITKSDNTQEVLISYDNYRYNLNYFYNRTKSNRNNQPLWLWDENQIHKVHNSRAVSFYGKSTLERLKGNYFMVRLERDGNTNYDLDFRWSEQITNPIA